MHRYIEVLERGSNAVVHRKNIDGFDLESVRAEWRKLENVIDKNSQFIKLNLNVTVPNAATMVNIAHPLIQTLHRAICMVYDCDYARITFIHDSKEKQCAVFMLKQFYGYLPNDIALPYSISIDRVHWICDKMPQLYGVSVNFQNDVKFILDYVEKNCEA